MDGFTTRAMEEAAEAVAFGEAIYALTEKMQDVACRVITYADRGDFTIPPGTDCAAFEARVQAVINDMQSMLDGYRPGERRAA